MREASNWPLLFYEFFAYGGRSERSRDKFARRRRVAQEAIGALMNGLAFKRVADPESVPEGLFGLTMSRLLFALLAVEPAGGERAAG